PPRDLPSFPTRRSSDLEEAASRDFAQKVNECLHCTVLAKECDSGVRVVASNDSFTAFAPYFARFPYEVHIYSKRHCVSNKYEPQDRKSTRLNSSHRTIS